MLKGMLKRLMTNDDLRTVEHRTDLAFGGGEIAGKVVKGYVSKGFRWAVVTVVSFTFALIFFFAGFISSRKIINN